ncbi:hypothetical protein [Schaalia sp. Marseille-Q2122]|uniref:hypothetical protein n=1 Tax=Schaalia sp. Marseille-Q2122 TaxID=2736604 RepID=UPI0015889944|nr:hypothetical protein [Schaalia sp. Marseille-Q2122]
MIVGASAVSLGLLPNVAAAQPLEENPLPSPATTVTNQDNRQIWLRHNDACATSSEVRINTDRTLHPEHPPPRRADPASYAR